MKKEEIEIHKGNVLIARFCSEEPEVLERDLLKAGTIQSMHYHDDWGWVMPVCHKWDNLPLIRSKNKVIYKEYVALSEYLDHAVTLYEIPAIFTQLVHNIEWYNKLKKI